MQSMAYVELAEYLQGLCGGDGLVLVGIDAPGSSGKSTFAGRLASAGAQVVRMDDLQGGTTDTDSAQWASKKAGSTKWVWGRLEEEVIKPLRRGERARYRVYDWSTRRIGSREKFVDPRGIVILEGLSSTRGELRDYYDFRIWVECHFEIKRQRALDRHAQTRTAGEIESWIEEERAYIAAHQPRHYAHLIVSGIEETSAPEESFVLIASPGLSQTRPS